MKYIIREDESKRNVSIKDVQVVPEELYEDDGTRYGRVRVYDVSLRELKKYMERSIKDGSIISFEKQGLSYRIQRCSITDGNVDILTDDISFSASDYEVCKLIEWVAKLFAKKGEEAQSKAMKAIIEQGNNDDKFAQAARALLIYGISNKLPEGMGKEDAEKLLKLYGSYEHLFSHTPVDKEAGKNGLRKPSNRDIKVFTLCCALATAGFAWTSISNPYALGILLTAIFGAASVYGEVFNRFKSQIDGYSISKKQFWDAVSGIEGEYEIDYEIGRPKVQTKEKGLVTFGKKTLAYVERKGMFDGALEQVNFLKLLLGNYTEDKIAEYFYGESGPERRQYMKSLFSFERGIYDKNKTVGFLMDESPNLTIEDLVDRLSFLGCTQEEVATLPLYRSIVNAFDAINYKPYEGCEVELIDLIWVACEYHCDREDDLEESPEYYEGKVVRILDKAQYKREYVRRLERQAEEKIAKESSLSEEDNMQNTANKNMTLLPKREGDVQNWVTSQSKIPCEMQ